MQMLKEFKYSFEELSVNSSDIEELMGFEHGIIPDPFPEIIKKGLSDAPKLCNITGGFKIFNSINVDKNKKSIQIDDQEFLPAKIVVSQLKNATSAALFICTAGPEISTHSQKISNHDDPLLGYVFDIIGSLAVEKATDKIQEELNSQVNKTGLSISDRYSPGYCEWSVADQQKLFALLPDNFCGITLSCSSLMNPIKSVSGIIGIGLGLKQKGYQCHWCDDLNCIYGKMNRQKRLIKDSNTRTQR